MQIIHGRNRGEPIKAQTERKNHEGDRQPRRVHMKAEYFFFYLQAAWHKRLEISRHIGYNISKQQINTETGMQKGDLGANKSKRHLITYIKQIHRDTGRLAQLEMEDKIKVTRPQWQKGGIQCSHKHQSCSCNGGVSRAAHYMLEAVS